MALKNLLTDLTTFYDDNPYQDKYKGKAGPAYVKKQPFLARNLSYGNDRPGGGSSGQPFIVKRIPNVNSAPTEQFPDFILRDPKNALNNRRDDLERITKFLKTTQGTLFIAKQELLSLQNPLVPGRPNRSNPVAGLYNPAMTLAQVAGAGTGLHIEKQGLTPIFTDTVKYETVYRNRFNSNDTNRLVLLRAIKIGNPTGPAEPIEQRPDLTYSIGAAEKLGVSRNPNLLLSYTGGANANLGGKTNIPFAGNRVYDKANLDKEKASLRLSQAVVSNVSYDYYRYLGATQKGLELGYLIPGVSSSATSPEGKEWNETNNKINTSGQKINDNTIYLTGNTFPDTNKQLTTALGIYTFKQTYFTDPEKTLHIGRLGSTDVIQDFRKIIREDKSQGKGVQTLLFTDYTNPKINRETRVGLGRPGKRSRDRSNLTIYDNDTVDIINMVPLYAAPAVQAPSELTRDLVKFRFEVIDNITPTNSTFVHFRAFLGTITDGFTADWDSIKYVGRGEKFYTYNGFNRTVSFTFDVHPQSRGEMKPIYQKLNYLATTLAPDYNQGYMKGNLIKLTIGDYLYRVPGIITSLTYTIPEEAPWEIALTEPENGGDKGLLETPKLINVNVSFTPIHNFVPQIGADQSTALITRQTSDNPYLSGTNIETDASRIVASNLIQYATSGSKVSNVL